MNHDPDELQACALCLQDRALLNSHIWSEFLYSEIYDEKHRAKMIDLSQMEPPKTIQKGIREPLLCDECETQLSGYESYSARVLRSIPNVDHSQAGTTLEVPDVDYHRFKLFQMSLLWRASVTTESMFSRVDLGPYEEELRQLLTAGDPGSKDDFGCLMGTICRPNVLASFTRSPVKMRIQGRIAYNFLLFGFHWFFVVARDSCLLPHAQYFIDTDNVLRLPVSGKTEESEVGFLAELLRDHSRVSKG